MFDLIKYFFKNPRPNGIAVKLTTTSMAEPIVIDLLKDVPQRYINIGDYLWVFDEFCTVVPAKDFFRSFAFTDEEVPNLLCEVTQTRKWL